MVEILDVFDADMKLLGSADRNKVHEEGLWHRTFHLWIISNYKGGSILFQRRSDEKQSFPGMLDISAAGHLESGEQPLDGIREVQEELGLRIAPDMMEFLGYRVEVSDEGGKFNREHQAVYIARIDLSLEEFQPDPKEVNGLTWLSIDDVNLLMSSEITRIQSEAMIYDISGEIEKRDIQIDKDSFLPRIQPYYLTVGIMARRYLNGERPISI